MLIQFQSTMIPNDSSSAPEHLFSYLHHDFIHHRTRKSWYNFPNAIFSDHVNHLPTASRYSKYYLIVYLNLENHRDRTFRWKSTSRSRIFKIRDFSQIWHLSNALSSLVMFYAGKNAPTPIPPCAIWSKMPETPKSHNSSTNHLFASLKAPAVFLGSSRGLHTASDPESLHPDDHVVQNSIENDRNALNFAACENAPYLATEAYPTLTLSIKYIARATRKTPIPFFNERQQMAKRSPMSHPKIEKLNRFHSHSLVLGDHNA